jgi:hydrogenase maturation protease
VDAPILIIGVGNPDRGDDAAGLAVAQALSKALAHRALHHVAIRESSGDGAALLSAWQGFAVVIVVDATAPNENAGCIRRLDAVAQPLPTVFFAASTHAFGVAQGVEMARALGLLPPTLIVYGIEGRQFTLGTPMSAAVRDAVSQVTSTILAELEETASP